MLLALALTLGVGSNPQSAYHLDCEIDTVEYVLHDNLGFKVPVVNGWMPEKIVVHHDVLKGTETRHFYFESKLKHDKKAKYHMPKPGIGLSEDGVETDRAYTYELVK
jgi:hypothetical protein